MPPLPTRQTPPLVALNASIASNGKPLLDDIAIAIHHGERVGLIGASGAGKSLLASALMGLLPTGLRLDGELRLLGKPVNAHDDRSMCQARRGRLSMIFQNPATALNPLLPIGKQIAEAIRLAGNHANDKMAISREVDNALCQVGLTPHHRHRLPQALSGGQQQRVMIAMAVAARSKLLIADEATTSLDSVTQASILSLLRDLASAHRMALLLISHDMAVVAHCCQRFLVMAGGRIVDRGTALSQLHHPTSRALLAASRQHYLRPQEPKQSQPLLKVAGVGKQFHGMAKPTLTDISFTLNRGEMLGLVGASGVGKSTLARIVLGLETTSHGSTHLGDIAISPTMPAHHRRHFSAVFQNPATAMNPRHTIATIVAEPLRLLGRAQATAHHLVADALHQVGLPNPEAALHAYPHGFSGGEKQRIAIARALITSPRLIVFDEATSSLDAATRQRILSLISQLVASRGLAGLFISHDLGLVRCLCHRVLVMADGRIVEAGDADTVLNSPSHPASQALLNGVLNLPKQI